MKVRAAAMGAMVLGAAAAAAQGLPVRQHGQIMSFRGDVRAPIAAEGDAVYSLYSAHKEARRPWADAIFLRRKGNAVTYLSRAYDCAAGTYRWMGEAAKITEISLSVASVDQVRDRRLEPGSIEYKLARHVCAL